MSYVKIYCVLIDNHYTLVMIFAHAKAPLYKACPWDNHCFIKQLMGSSFSDSLLASGGWKHIPPKILGTTIGV